jgi:hypothetical protein
LIGKPFAHQSGVAACSRSTVSNDVVLGLAAEMALFTAGARGIDCVRPMTLQQLVAVIGRRRAAELRARF